MARHSQLPEITPSIPYNEVGSSQLTSGSNLLSRQAKPPITPRADVNSSPVLPSQRLLGEAEDDHAQYATYPPIERDSEWKGMAL